MKKIFYIHVFLVVILCDFLVPKVYSASKENDKQIIVRFTSPLPVNRIPVLVQQFNLTPKEFYYETNDISGGYKISDNENVSEAIKNILQKHIQFLNESMGAIENFLPEIRDEAMLSGLINLNKEFKELLNEAKGGSFRISAIRLNDNLNISALVKKGIVESIIPVSKKKRKNIKKYDENLTTKNDSDFYSSSHQAWAPYKGTSKVTQSMTFQTFYFNSISEFKNTSTYEHETQIYDINFADYDNYWSCNLPRAYYDTQFLDEIDNFTIGSAQASSIKTNKMYYTHMSLKKGSSLNATVIIKGQKGHRSPSWCYSTWCVYADETTDSMARFTAPQNKIRWEF